MAAVSVIAVLLARVGFVQGWWENTGAFLIMAGGIGLGAELMSLASKDVRVTFTLNGEQATSSHRVISYDEVVKLAYPDRTVVPGLVYSVAWSVRGKNERRGGTLNPGGLLKLADGMVINAAVTGNA
jgi:hypothetical protein